MKRMKRIWALALCVCALMILAGCAEKPDPTTIPTTAAPTEPPLTPREKYDLAQEAIQNASNWILNYTLEETRVVGEDTYTETAQGTASFSKLNQADMVAVVEEQLSYGTYTSAYREVYCEGAAYAQVNESSFTAEMTPEQFVQRQLPAVLLSSNLYRTVAETVNADTTVLSFSQAKGAEHWLGDGNIQIVQGTGTATLDNTGMLKETTCQVEYMLGDVRYTVNAVVRVTAPPALDLGATHQQHIRNSIEIESLDVPKMLLRAVGDVYATGRIYCDAVESIYSDAVQIAYSQRSIINMTGMDEELCARAEYMIHMSDDRGNVSAKTQIDAFENSVFSSSQDGEKPVQNPNVTAQQMRRYCEDVILSALAAPKYLKNASLETKRDSYRLEIEGNHDFVMDMMANISQFLQVDLDEKATGKKTLSAGAYLVIDRETGLPTAMGLNMERQHTIDTVTYRLTYSLEQTMALSDYE